jgi:hypothetical protein
VTGARWDDHGNIIVTMGGTTCHYSDGLDQAQEQYNLAFNLTWEFGRVRPGCLNRSRGRGGFDRAGAKV